MTHSHPLAIALLLLAVGMPAQSAPDSIARVADLAQLPRLEPGVVCRAFASTDPRGRGEDHGNFLRRNGKRSVLAEMEGPGVVARLWSANPAGTLYVTLDGEPEPRIAAPFADLFDGKYPPFCAPLAMRTSGGSISYFPIPYAKSCRIEVGEHPDPRALYYQVQYLTYPKGTPLRTFTRELPESEQKALAAVQASFARKEPKSEPALEATGPVLAPGELRNFVTLSGSGHVRELQALIACAQQYERAILLEIFYDGAAEPSIRVPLLDAFGLGFAANTEVDGWIVGRRAGRGYLRLPMPFRTGIRIALRNPSTRAASVTVTASVEKGPVAANEGYLHGEFRCQDRLQAPLYRWAQIAGRGKLVGISQAIQGVGSLWYLEGNEIITVDGEAKPSIVGTGTEDFYNGGWYWDRGTFAAPFWGLNQKQEWTTNRTMPWRFFVPDAIPFARSLVADLEQGSASQVRDAYYSSVAWWYGERPEGVRTVTLAEATVPRIWVTAQKGWQPANSLRWSEAPKPELELFEEFTTDHRSLDRPLFQAFPATHVETESAPLDVRAVVMPGNAKPSVWRAKFDVAYADSFWIDLRAYGARSADELQVDGARAGMFRGGLDSSDLGPRVHTFGPLSLRQGEHDLALLLAEHSHAIALDALRLRSASPFVRQFWLGPAVPASAKGSVEEEPAVEQLYLAPDFLPERAGWKLVEVRGEGIDLAHELTRQAPVFAYVAFSVHSPQERTANVLLGSDDGVRVWVNGTLAWSHAIHRPAAPDQDRFAVTLRKGPNRFLVKVRNDDGGFGLIVRICTP